MQGVQIIEQSGALVPEDMQFLKDNIAQVNENWEKKQRFRTETEMLFSVLNDFKHPTPAAKYWQAVREQSVQYEELVRLSFDYRRTVVEIRKLKKEINQEVDDDERELKQIDLEEKEFQRASSEAVAKDRMREIRLWQEIMNEISADANFDTEDVNTHQAESHFYRMQNAAAQINEHTPPAERTNALGQYHSIVNRIKAGRLGNGNLKLAQDESGLVRLEKVDTETKKLNASNIEEITNHVRTGS